MYELGDLLAVAFLTYLSGYKDYADMDIFTRNQARNFGRFPYTDRNPSRDTFERLFVNLNTDYVEQAVIEQGRRILDILEEKQIAIDRKKLCGTASKEKGPKGDYLLNSYVTENSLFIGLEKLRDKENEIPATPRLLDRLELRGAVVSIDAIGTQVNIAEQIGNAGGHYLLAVKENQGNLLCEMCDVMKYQRPTSTHTETEKEHARVETLTVSIYPTELMDDMEILGRWNNLRTLGKVEPNTVYVSENGREEKQLRYSVTRISPKPLIMEVWQGDTVMWKKGCTGIST